MNIEIAAKLASVIIGIFSLAKIYLEITGVRRSRAREEYKFAKEFLCAIEDEKIHPFAKEKGYQAISGDASLKGAEVAYLLSLREPEKALKNYVMGRSYLKHLPNRGNLQIDFDEKYKTDKSRKLRKWLYTSIYGIFSFGTMAPLVFSKYISDNIGNIFALFFIFAITLFPIGLAALREAARIHRAERLVESQHRHTQLIAIDPQWAHKDRSRLSGR